MKTLTLVRRIGALASWFGPSLLVFGAETTFGSRDFFPNPPAPQTTCEAPAGDPSSIIKKAEENDKRLCTNRDECIDSAPLSQGPTYQDDVDNLLPSLQRKIQRQKQQLDEAARERQKDSEKIKALSREKSSLEIQLQLETQARKAAEEQKAELMNAFASKSKDFNSCRSCIHNGVVRLQCMLEDVENYYSGKNEQAEALAITEQGCRNLLSCFEQVDSSMSQL